MGVGYYLVNATKREVIRLTHVGGNKQRELAGDDVTSSIVTWYMIENRGDRISFVSDTYGEWPFGGICSRADVDTFKEVTDATIDALIAAEILEDHGIAWRDEDEPDLIYTRDIRNRWNRSTP